MSKIHSLFAYNLKTLRNKRNLTQAVLAEKCSLSTNYISDMEAGRKFPSPNVFEKIAEILMVKPYNLLLEPDETALYNNKEVTYWVLNEIKKDIDIVVDNYIKKNEKPSSD